MINEQKFHILDLNETRLSKDITDPEVELEGFENHRKDRDVNGGGVAIFVNSSISHNRRYDIDDPLLEIVAVEITPLHAKNCIVICWYRPPTPGKNKKSFEAPRNLLSAVDAEGKEIILIGDTNCDLKNHKDGCTKSIKSVYSEFQFEQQINEYTRVAPLEKDGAPHTSKTLIDHFATNRPDYILRASVLKLGMVDHYLIFAVRKINGNRILDKQVKMVETRSLRNYDKQLFLDELSAIDWNETLAPTNGDPDLMASIFNSVI